MTDMKRIACMTVCFALATGLASAAKIHTDHNPAVNFSGYKTYSWKAKPPREDADPTGNFRKLHRLVITTANDELNDRGYVQTEEQPDFYMSYSAVADAAAYLDVHYTQGWRVGRVRSYAAGNLVIEFTDGETSKAIWRGWAADGINPDKMDKRVPKFVRQILKKFPPPAAQQ